MARLVAPKFTSPKRAKATGLRALGDAAGSVIDQAMEAAKANRESGRQVENIVDELTFNLINKHEWRNAGFDSEQDAITFIDHFQVLAAQEGITPKEIDKLVRDGLMGVQKSAIQKRGGRALERLTGQEPTALEGIETGEPAAGPGQLMAGIDALSKRKAVAAAAEAQPDVEVEVTGPQRRTGFGPGVTHELLPPPGEEEGVLAGVPATQPPGEGVPFHPADQPGNPLVQLRNFGPEGRDIADRIEQKANQFARTEKDVLKFYEEAEDELKRIQQLERTFRGEQRKEKLRVQLERIKAASRLQVARQRQTLGNQAVRWLDLGRKVRAEALAASGDPTRAVALAIQRGGTTRDPDEAVQYLEELATAYETEGARLQGITLPVAPGTRQPTDTRSPGLF
jgi:hypothetical protein